MLIMYTMDIFARDIFDPEAEGARCEDFQTNPFWMYLVDLHDVINLQTTPGRPGGLPHCRQGYTMPKKGSGQAGLVSC
jgi:hypothetical protein